jgi:cell division septation protein DedD
MKKRSTLTYVLYGALALSVLIAGYYACQKQKDKQIKQEQDEAELQQTLRDLGYAHGDTSNTATGSAFVGGDTTIQSGSTPTTNQDGVEAARPSNTPATAKTPVQTKTPTTKPATPPATKTSTTPKAIAGPGAGRWAVRAGTFANQEGARRRLEDVIKQGYPNAAIVKTSDGKAAVVVFRSDDKKAAIRVVDQLEEKGIDAAVFDRKN